jgi:hypothetical protein
LREAGGEIRAATLVRALGALLRAAERATRLAATGYSVGRGRKPKWLEAAVDCTVTGMGRGSTTVEIRAPRLGDVPMTDLVQQDLWLQRPDAEDTALDLVANAITEAQMSDSTGEHYDRPVLEEIINLGGAARADDVRYELTSSSPNRKQFVLEASASRRLRERLDLIPSSRASVVSGELDEIGHGLGRFRLLMTGGQSLQGLLDRSRIDVEMLRPLWGNPATVQGMVHFKPSGQARLIEAHRISSRTDGDAVFGIMPKAHTVAEGASEYRSSVKSYMANPVDPMMLWGAWPGDEPIEALLAELD